MSVNTHHCEGCGEAIMVEQIIEEDEDGYVVECQLCKESAAVTKVEKREVAGGETVSIPARRFPVFHAGDLAQALKGAGNQVTGNVQILTVAGPRYLPLKEALEVAITFLEEYQRSLPSPFHDDDPSLPRSSVPAPPVIDVEAEEKKP